MTMNNNRRQRLTHNSIELSGLSYLAGEVVDAIEKLNTLKSHLDDWSSLVHAIESAIEQIEQEEQRAYDSIPENLQLGDIALNIDYSLSNLAEAKQSVSGLKDFIDEVEDAYFKGFLPSFNPLLLLEKLNSFIEAIEDAKTNVDYAKE